MTIRTEFYADIDEFELGYEGIYAVVNLFGKDESGDREQWNWERAEYPRSLVPVRGRYIPAKFTISVTVAAEPQRVEETVGSVESVAEFEAEVFELDVDSPVFWLRDVEDGTAVGEMELQPDRMPDWVDSIGDRAYVTVRMTYDHERTVNVVAEGSGRTEEDLIHQREATKEMFEEWEEEYL